MAVLDDLINKVEDPVLRERLRKEVHKATKHKKFGLVFEEHLPECTPLYDVPIKKGSRVAERDTEIKTTYTVKSINGDDVVCVSNDNKSEKNYKLKDIVVVAEFGEPIYPYLQTIDTVCNAPDSDLWHTLIEADNYHALQLLEYMYAGKVDCIYIDPPYNKEDSKDWKYNCNYVDGNDMYRHSKWLSMMERRLRLAKKLLNPKKGVLIVTIDELEMHHLRTLLEQIFPEAHIQMATDVINPKGNPQDHLSRVEEYVIFCFMPEVHQILNIDNMLGEKPAAGKVRWYSLLRSGNDSTRANRKDMFYPVLIDDENGRVVRAGDPLPFEEHPVIGQKIDGYSVAWPIRNDGSEGRWYVSPKTLNEMIERKHVRLGSFDSDRKTWAINYLGSKHRRQIESGELVITGVNEKKQCVEVSYPGEVESQVKTVWYRSSHDAGTNGSSLITDILGEKNTFSFPKSLYSEKDAIGMIVRSNPEALILDFFAGSGTTLHAVNLLNAEDGGHRRCIMVTNNEIGEKQEIKMRNLGYRPGNEEWESLGIAKYVTWPRTVCSIEGRDVNGHPLKGECTTINTDTIEKDRNIIQINYINDISSLNVGQKKQLVSLISSKKLPQKLVTQDSKYVLSEDEKYTVSVLLDDTAADDWLEALNGMDHIKDLYIITSDNKLFKNVKAKIKEILGPTSVQVPVAMPMADGFRANAIYFKLGFLDKDAVALGRQFKELLGVLWMKAGAIGPCPHLAKNATVPEMMILPQNKMAVLVNDVAFTKFEAEIQKHPEIETVYIVTDSDRGYREMAASINVKNTYQLYRDYLDNFRINHRR